MKARLASLVEYEKPGGGRYMSGILGDAVVILQPDGETRDGKPRWCLLLAVPKRSPDKQERERNRRGASWRIQRRKAEGIEILGGE